MDDVLTVMEVSANLKELEGKTIVLQGVLFASCEDRRCVQRKTPRSYSVLFPDFGRLSLSCIPGDYVAYLAPLSFDMYSMQKQGLLRWLHNPKNIGFKLLHLLPKRIARTMVWVLFPTPVVKIVSQTLADRLRQIFPDRIGSRWKGYKTSLVVEITGRVAQSSLPEFAFVVSDVTQLKMHLFARDEGAYYDKTVSLS